MKHLLLLIPAWLALATNAAWGWSEPHQDITRAALASLPASARERLGNEIAALGDHYCLIPDQVYTDRDNARFAMMDSRPGVLYLVQLHLPAHQPENFEILRYFIDHAVTALRTGDVTSAAKYCGTISHVLEDWSCPAHAVPGDNMFTLMQQFLPPPPEQQHRLLHSPIESGHLPVKLAGRKPEALGTTIDEAAFRLLQRVNEATVFARRQTIPIIQALYGGDTGAVARAQLPAATTGATVVADALFTVISLAAEAPATEMPESLRQCDLTRLYPLEATNLYFSQATFFGKPHWGHARMGSILAGGSNAVPLELRMNTNGPATRVFTNGIGTGTRSSLTYLLPPGVFKRFSAFAGLHPELGRGGSVEFTVLGDGRTLATVTRSGGDEAYTFDCDISGVTNLQLVANTPKSADAKRSYAIWAEPKVAK